MILFYHRSRHISVLFWMSKITQLRLQFTQLPPSFAHHYDFKEQGLKIEHNLSFHQSLVRTRIRNSHHPSSSSKRSFILIELASLSGLTSIWLGNGSGSICCVMNAATARSCSNDQKRIYLYLARTSTVEYQEIQF